jgi:hypothetical protein
MISFAGFGYTTPDLIQNSEAVTFSDYDVGGEQVIALNVVTIKADFISEDNSFRASNSIVYFTEVSQEILQSQEGILETVLAEQTKPPLIHFEKDNKISYKPPLRTTNENVLMFRRARDGLTSRKS